MPLSKFLGIEKITDIGSLLAATEKASHDLKVRAATVFFPGACNFDVSYGYSNRSSIDLKKEIDMEKLLESLTQLVLSEYDGQNIDYVYPLFVNFRFKKYNVQITNGHLQRGDGGHVMPMHTIPENRERNRFIRTLKTYKAEEGMLEGKKKKPESISDLKSSYNMEKGDIVEGLAAQAVSFFKHEKTKAEVGEALGFKVITKNSSGKLDEKGNDRCVATRTCVHSEEIPRKDLPAKIVETYRLMRKIRKEPSCIIGIENIIEIHLDSKRITVVCESERKGKTFEAFLLKVLGLIGVKDFDTASVLYEKEVTAADPLYIKAAAFLGCQLENAVNYFSQEKVKAFVNLLLLLVGTPLYALFVIADNHPILETVLVILPSVLFLSAVVYKRGNKSLTEVIGQYTIMGIYYAILFVLGGVYLLGGFDSFISLMGVCIIIGAINIWGEKVFPSLSKIFKAISLYADVVSQKILSNRLANGLFVIMTIIAAVIGFMMFGILAISMAPIFVLLVFIFIMLDGDFWSSYEYETNRYDDRFFSNFKGERPGLTEDCEIVLKKTRCWKLLIWVPTRAFFTNLVEYGNKKYPKCLRLSNIAGRVSKLLKKQVSKISS